MGRSQELYLKAKKIIPGGTQLLSKRPEMLLPGIWPAYYSRAKGCEVWDLDAKKYIDMSYMGIGSCVLGYADEDVDLAVKKAIDKASMATLNAPEEVDLARVLLKLHPWAGMVRFGRSGGEAMAIAVRIARAYSRKDVVLFSGYHGWHDWYLSANIHSNKALDGHLLPGLNPKGVPRKLEGTAYPFAYNDTKGFLELVKRHKGMIGAIVLESVRGNFPSKEFIGIVKKMSRELKVPLIVDEITAGFRLNTGGAHLVLGIEPDIAVFGKGMSNGFPMAAVIGKKAIMETAQETFISSTYWTERIGPAASLATIKKFRQEKVANHLKRAGKKIQQGWEHAASSNGLNIKISGIYPLSHFSFECKRPLVLKTLFTQVMLERGFLATNAFYASFAHKDIHIRKYLAEVDRSFRFLAKALRSGKPEKYLHGEVCHSGFKRLT